MVGRNAESNQRLRKLNSEDGRSLTEISVTSFEVIIFNMDTKLGSGATGKKQGHQISASGASNKNDIIIIMRNVMKYITLVRKIQVVPYGDKEEFDRVYTYIGNGIYNQNKAMNQMMNDLYRSYILDMDKEDRKTLTILYGRTGSGKKESAYKDIKFAVGLSIGTLRQKVQSDFSTAIKNGALYGEASFPQYTLSNPLLLHSDYIRLRESNPHHDFGIYHSYISKKDFLDHLYQNDVEIFWKFVNGITFKFKFGSVKKSAELRNVFEHIFDGSYQVCGSSIQINAKNQLILNLSIKIPVQETPLDENTVVGVDLGMAIPAMCALNNNPEYRQRIGSFDDFMRVKQKIKNEKRRIQSSIRFSSGGHGRQKKLQAMDKFRDYERNWVKNYNHVVSRKVVDFAVKNHAKYINLEDLSGITATDNDDGKSSKLLRDWSYFQLQQFITYKAAKVGIEVRKIDPYHTSQICSCCGHWEEGQRITQDKFICKNLSCRNFGKIINADFNAARNIAMSTNFVSDKKKKNKQESETE